MSIVNRSVLKGYFADAKVPTASNFGDFIDSAINMANAAITIDASNRFGLGTSVPDAALSVQPQTLLPMTGTVSVAINSTSVTGTGTIFTRELTPGDAIRITDLAFLVASIVSDTSLTLDVAFPAASGPQTNVPAYRDGDAFCVTNGLAHSLMLIDQAGNVGVGVAAPGAMLDVGGTVRAAAFTGNGAGLTGLDASQLSGTLVSTGSFDVALTGQGTILAGGTTVTGTGTRFTSELSAGESLQLTTASGSTVFTVAAITSDTQLSIATAATAAIANASLATLGALFEAKTASGSAVFAIDKTGNVTAPSFSGSGAGLTDLDAGQLSGTLVSSGSFNVTLTGTAAIAANSTTVTGTGTHFTTQLAVRDSLQLTTSAGSTVFTIATITSDTVLTVTAAPTTALASATLATLGALFEAKTQAGVTAVTIDKSGTVQAAGFVGSGADLTDLDAGQLSGTLVSTGSFNVTLTGTAAIAANSTTVTGTATHFTTQLAVGDSLQLTTSAGSTVFSVATITSDTVLTVTAAPTTALANATLATLGALFEAKTQAGAAAVTIDKSGVVLANGFIGSGAGLSGIAASQISGSFTPAQIPDIPAAKVTGTLAVAQIPDLRATELMLYAVSPVVVDNNQVTLSWLADSSYELTLTYLNKGASVVKSTAQGDFASGSGSHTVTGIYDDTMFTLTAWVDNQPLYQRQLYVTVSLTPAQYTSLVKAVGWNLTDALSALYYRYNYNPIDLTMIESLGYCLAAAGYPASDIFLAVANFYIATAGITTLSPAQIKALTDGVDHGSGDG